MRGDNVRIWNRTPLLLNAKKDGRDYTIPPGESWLPEDVVSYARAQNPVPGSDDPSTLMFESFISRIFSDREQPPNHPLDTIDEETYRIMQAPGWERIDRSQLPADRQAATQVPQPMFPRAKTRVGMEGPTEGMLDTKFGD